MRRWRRIGDLNPLGTRNFLRAFFRGGKGVGSGLYRLPAFCHAESLIPAVRFFRKEKSSLPGAGYSLRRTGVPAQSTLEMFCAAAITPLVGMNFFFTKKWAGGRLSLRGVSARQEPKSCPHNPQKTGIQREPAPLGRCSRTASLRSCPA